MKALVTGGTKGIGLAITKMLLAEDYAVTATYAHDTQTARAIQSELSERGLPIWKRW